MYPRNAQYYALPTDSESSQAYQFYTRPLSLKNHIISLGRSRIFRLGSLTLIMLATFFMAIYQILWGGAIIFYPSDRPTYLDVPVNRPIVIRLAIMARVDAFQRRQVIREAVLDGVPASDVQLEYKFFVGRAKGGKSESQRTMLKLAHENEVHKDIVIMDDIEDVPERISEKRFNGLKWANSIPKDQYDYAMTMDSDTFCRFRTLARRLHHIYPSLRPRDEPIMIGRMSRHSIYYENTVPDGNKIAKDEDYWVTGPVYPYPVGIGYMLSSNLTATILSADPAVPHHINYPYDDVMIGSWVAGLEVLGDPEAVFEDQEPRSSLLHSKEGRRVHPAPYLPYSVHTKIIDDTLGWHDYRHRGGAHVGHAIGWETACVHKVSALEMTAFRARKEIEMEWDY